MSYRQGDVVAKKFEVEGLLGDGPTGESYAARSLGSGKKVCIKILAGPSVGDTVASQVLARIQAVRSDALVPIIETGEHNGSLYVVTEFFEAESLRRLMDSYAGERKPFTLQEACQIVVRVLEAVEAAHESGLVHRHVKPANVLVNSRSVGPGRGKTVRTIKLNGLGLSEMIQPGTLAENLAEHADVRYLAPELASPSSGGTVQTDIYSVGVMFYELLCGQTPMGTYLSPTQVREDLPKHVDDIVDIAINANAEDRYPSARDMINDIQRSFTDDDKPAARTSMRTMGTVVGGSVLVLLAIGVFLGMNDPATKARSEDDALRAKVIRENPIDAAVQEQKSAGHPNMAYIPKGTTIIGRMHAESDKVARATEPLSVVTPVEAYYIDLFEYPNEVGAFPVVNATRADAEAACASQGKRLCTATEWERACKGPEMNIYGYGLTFNPETCGTDPGGDKDRDDHLDRASGSKEGCKSGWGVYDLSGGAAEWVSGSGSDPRFGLQKGGMLGQPEQGFRCAFTAEMNSGNTNRAIGFRCCMDDNGQLPLVPTPAGGAPPAEAPPTP
jgi:serine/threonine protein kinase